VGYVLVYPLEKLEGYQALCYLLTLGREIPTTKLYDLIGPKHFRLIVGRYYDSDIRDDLRKLEEKGLIFSKKVGRDTFRKANTDALRLYLKKTFRNPLMEKVVFFFSTHISDAQDLFPKFIKFFEDLPPIKQQKFNDLYSSFLLSIPLTLTPILLTNEKISETVEFMKKYLKIDVPEDFKQLMGKDLTDKEQKKLFDFGKEASEKITPQNREEILRFYNDYMKTSSLDPLVVVSWSVFIVKGMKLIPLFGFVDINGFKKFLKKV